MAIITNMKELCDWSWVDYDRCSADYFSHRMYKGTDCGASMSIAVKTEPTTPEITYRARLIRSGEHADVQVMGTPTEEVMDFLGMPFPDPLVWETALSAIQETSAARRVYGRYSGWKFKLSYTQPSPEIVDLEFFYPAEGEITWYHNGDRTDLWGKELYGFSIQTIVEGSDVDINGPTFTVPVDTKEVDKWIKEMESEATAAWERANTQLYSVEKGGYRTAYLRVGGFDNPRWEELPLWIRAATRRKIEQHCNNLEPDWSFDDREDVIAGWTITKIDKYF